MAMVVNHNLPAINANRQLGINNRALSKSIEKLSSGMQINRAADNAAGLAISEKMRGQINGLEQASKNAQDGISLIQTAEGALNETHDILQRMRTLAVQSANGTYQDDVDREAIQLEVDALKSEIDRISTSTHYNGIKLLDGSLGGSTTTTEYGAKYGSKEALLNTTVTTTSNVAGAQINFTVGASGKGGENAVWDAKGLKVNVNLAAGKSYTDAEIQDLIDNATLPKDGGMTAAPASITFKSANGVITAAAATTTATVAGVRSTQTADLTDIVADGQSGGHGSSDSLVLTANSYGAAGVESESIVQEVKIIADVAAGKETVETTADAGKGDKIVLHLSTGVEYSEKDIENILKEAGYDYSAKLTDATNTDGDADGKLYINVAGTEVTATAAAGAGVGNTDGVSGGKGLTFQIGANGVADQRVTLNVDDMSSSALKIANISVATRDGANKAIDVVDNAINTVSMQRAGLGALQNRLEHTINSLDVANENLTSAESAIRDTDMAKEMMKFTKQQILSQASQAMLAQANQLPQGVLQLLQ